MGTDIPSHGIGEPSLDQPDGEFRAMHEYMRGGVHAVSIPKFIQMPAEPVVYDRPRAIALMRAANERRLEAEENGEDISDPDLWRKDRDFEDMVRGVSGNTETNQ